MAIGRISGQLLKSNLTRDGVDLAFENDLLYLKVSPAKQGSQNSFNSGTASYEDGDPNFGETGSNSGPASAIGIKTDTPQYDLDVNGSLGATSGYLGYLKVDDVVIDTNIIKSDLGNLILQAGPLGNISVSDLRITDVAAPTGYNDAVNKSYVDQLIETEISESVPAGAIGQVPFIAVDGTRKTAQDYTVKFGQFIETDQELTEAQTRVVSFETVFNSWTRFSHNSTENQPANAAELNGWSYNSTTDRISSTINSSTYIGLISTERYSSYIHEVRLSSTNSDDDGIGVIIAWHVDPITGRQHTLSAIRSTGGIGPVWQIVYNYLRSDQAVIANGNSFVTAVGGWSLYPSGTKVKIVREGDLITAETTQVNSETYLTGGAVLSIDLKSNPLLEKFRGPKSYGYSAYSQASATYSVILFSGTTNAIYDMRDGRAYYYAGTSWTLQNASTTNIWTDIGVGRLLHDVYTKKTYYVDSSSSILRIDIPNDSHTHDSRYYTETESDNRFVNVDGDTMTGYLTLNDDPIEDLHAVTKQYVDSSVSSVSDDLLNNLEVHLGVNDEPNKLVRTDDNGIIQGGVFSGRYLEIVYDIGNSGTAVTPDWDNGTVQTVIATDNFTLNIPTNMPTGASLSLIITQDGTGNRTMTADPTYKFSSGSKTLSTAANTVDFLNIFNPGTGIYLASLTKGYA